ncbi:PREDICTED: vomeronasal type-1 receptor 1-like, partial [Elephantulus edwardii]|uniref:vomeronasal type-1 receptor 1-like n=1 Tax=Elephantulus edwardii TaxID=28737 RepID=UPI0003F06823
MNYSNLEMGIIFITQNGAGILGNTSLLCLYSFALLTGHKMRPTDLIVNQLVLANNLVLSSRGISQTMEAFGWRNFLGDIGCKVVMYLHRVARGVSLNTTCLLSGFQALRLRPSSPRWIRSPMNIALCCSLCWFLNLLMNSFIPIKVLDSQNIQNGSGAKSFGYCSSNRRNTFTESLHTALFFSTDAVCLVLMLWASGFMVLVLHRHRQQVQYIHRNSLSPRPSPEARITRTILMLVTT